MQISPFEIYSGDVVRHPDVVSEFWSVLMEFRDWNEDQRTYRGGTMKRDEEGCISIQELQKETMTNKENSL
jgi:hypothetical protein